MNIFKWSFFVAVLIALPSLIFAQMVVPRGWEDQDSIRIAARNAIWASGGPYYGEDDARVMRIQDSLGFNIISDFTGFDGTKIPFGGRCKGYISFYNGIDLDLPGLARSLVQRIYYPSPQGIGIWNGGFDAGYRWRFIDTADYTWHNNTYDSNDVSPYAEFDKDPNFVTQTYLSRMKHSTPDTLQVGTDGRLILGYNDNRRADQMFTTIGGGKWNEMAPFMPLQTAKAFSARLEFSLDTIAGHIDSSHWSGSNEDLPLLRIQILFKRGGTDSGWSVFPFTPFKDSSNGTQAGWLRLVDTMITPAIYHTLRESWRVRDTLENNTASHIDWFFKQLNLKLENLPSYVQIDTVTDFQNTPEYGFGTQSPDTLRSLCHPDSLVAIDSASSRYITNFSDPSENPTKVPLVEIRLFSTYRTKVRIRSLSWQDTIEDKFLYRARFGDSTHSLNPYNDSYGGFDDSVKKRIESYAGVIATSGSKIRELLVNDVAPGLMATQMSGIGYVDFMLSRSKLHTHMRPQEMGGMSEAMRRERLSYDGIPPSVCENQYSNFYSQKNRHGFFDNVKIDDVFPGDYIPNSSLGSGSSWLTNSLDTMQGLLIARPGDSTDFYKGYRTYSETEEIQTVCSILRGSAYTGLRHPQKKKQAVESSPDTWAGISTQAYEAPSNTAYSWVFPHDTLHGTTSLGVDTILRVSTFAASMYRFRPTTPEENTALYYTSLANGIASFNIAPCIDGDNSPSGGTVTLFGVSLRAQASDPSLMDYSYNFGHRRSGWASASGTWFSSSHNVVDTTLPPYYLGFSNQFRATYRAESRMNQIYDTLRGNTYPLKRFTWLDAYSTHKAIQTASNTVQTSDHKIDTSNAATYRGAFLKCFCSTKVKLWEKGAHGEFLDSILSDQLVPDSARRTYAEVGLFKDSINS
ncbi:MAG: hypothetical protein Q8919_11530, partial [Bacteroidota bacterium]|nr:hypothetical protein [Bacteroidota bacterium]